MSEYPALLRAVVARADLDAPAMEYAIGAMMDGTWSAGQAGAFLAALAAKGETSAEVVGAAVAMRARGIRLEHGLRDVADTCGTGGDGAATINVSTAAAFAIAGAGLPVAKHGNRAASSACGSADVLEASQIAIDAAPELARTHLERDGFAFLFAPTYHPAARAVAPLRRELGVRTIFNVLGPLANHARATHQVVGVASLAHLELVGDALAALGSASAAIVHATSGIDEVAGDVPTHVYEVRADGSRRRWLLDPRDYGVAADARALAGGDAAFNARALASIVGGERSDRAEVVALNAALLLVVADRVADLREGLELARDSLRGGAARSIFETLRAPRSMEFV